jgi:xanthine dehydrogenase YagR molybdenum-binding subunit
MIDEVAQKLNIDPIKFRLKNYVLHDQVSGIPYSAKNLDRCYRRGAELIGWSRNPSLQQVNGTKRRAIGMASLIWGGGGGPPAYAWVRLNQDATVEVITGSQDIGTGTRTVMAQIAAEELGLDVSKVSVRLGDTSSGPYDPVSWGSMTVSSVGPAVRQAAIDARNQLRDIFAGYLDKQTNGISILNGQVYLGDETTPSHSVKEILEEIGDLTILGKGAREPNKSDKDVRTFGAQFADIEVDTMTGEVSVLNIVTVHDNGRVMNPLGSQSQAEGALIQGIGYALSENRVIDKRTGIVLNANMEEYLLPTALDFNDIGFDFINKPDNQSNSLGAKGLGEPALIPTAPAIANALKGAAGIRFTSLPITRDKILQVIQEKGAAR